MGQIKIPRCLPANVIRVFIDVADEPTEVKVGMYIMSLDVQPKVKYFFFT